MSQGISSSTGPQGSEVAILIACASNRGMSSVRVTQWAHFVTGLTMATGSMPLIKLLVSASAKAAEVLMYTTGVRSQKEFAIEEMMLVNPGAALTTATPNESVARAQP